MTKRRSKSLFVLFSIILVILLIASFVNFTYPFAINGNFYSYSNFVVNLRLGEDIGSSLRIVYRVDLPDGVSDTNIDDLKNVTMSGLKSIVQGEGYKDVTIAKMADDKIVLQVGNILSRTDESNITYLVGDPESISFYTSSSKSEENLVATSQDVASVEVLEGYDGSNNVFVVEVKFKDAEKIRKATSSASSIYIFFGDELFTTSGMSLGDGGIQNGTIDIQSSAFVDKATATSYANKIRTGMLPLNLTAIESGMITPSYGNAAYVWVAVVMALFVLAGFVYLIVRFRQLGWLASFNLLFFITISLFLLQSIPVVHINFSGIIAMAVCFVVAISTLVTIFERAKIYYNQDTKLYVAMRASQNESAMKIFIYNLLLMVVGFACLFMPSMPIQSMGWVFLVMPIVNLFTSLALMRLFIAMYMPLNNLDGKKCNFHKGGKNA